MNTLNLTALTTAVATITLLSISDPVHAQAVKGKAPVAAKKPATPPPAKAASGPIVLGTTQLPGDFGQIGQTFTIGTREPLNFTLDSATYKADRYNVGVNLYIPKKDEKLLVLRYTVHNPNPRDLPVHWGSLHFTAVDGQDVNRDALSVAVRPGTTEPYSASLKPAQKVTLETAILVPANGPVPKLIVERERGTAVIRYDLRGKAQPLPAPYADPADTTGATLRAEVPVPATQTIPVGSLDATAEAVGESAGPLLSYTAKAGERFVTVTVRLKNTATTKQRIYWADWKSNLIDADGEKTPMAQVLLKGSRDEKGEGDLEPGEEKKVRFFFPLSTKVQPKVFQLADRYYSGEKGRTFSIDLSGLPAAK